MKKQYILQENEQKFEFWDDYLHPGCKFIKSQSAAPWRDAGIENAELLSCPFCGAKVELVQYYDECYCLHEVCIECTSCFIPKATSNSGEEKGVYGAHNKVIKMWNTRVNHNEGGKYDENKLLYFELYEKIIATQKGIINAYEMDKKSCHKNLDADLIFHYMQLDELWKEINKLEIDMKFTEQLEKIKLRDKGLT